MTRGNGIFSGTDNSATGTQFIQVIDGAGASKLTIALGDFILKADFVRDGADLILSGQDGDKILIREYFANAELPDLVSENGSLVDGTIAARLAGPLAPGQYAQTAQSGQNPIGVVEDAFGQVTAQRADGSRVELKKGDPVYQGDVVETGGESAIGIRFADDTAFAMEDGGRIVLDQLIYNPASQSGSASLTVLQGAFVFVTGQIGHTNPDNFSVSTPLATIGIRGTVFGGVLGEQLDVYFDFGSGFVFNGAGRQDIAAGQRLTVASANTPPTAAVPLAEGEFDSTFGIGIDLLPRTQFFLDERDQGEEQEGLNEEEPSEQELAEQADFETAGGPQAGPTSASTGFQVATTFSAAQFTYASLQSTSFVFTTEAGILTGGGGEVGGGVPAPLPFEPNIETPLVTPSLSLTGTAGPDVLNGGSGNDTFVGGGGNDILNSGAGDDILIGGPGDDTLIGGTGTDTAVFSGNFADYSFGTGSIHVIGPDGHDYLTGIEKLQFADGTFLAADVLALALPTFTGSDGADFVVGTDGADMIIGGGGDDIISGGGGNDAISGGAGNDIIIGGAGNDKLSGGEGIDTAIFSGNYADYDVATDGSRVTGADGNDKLSDFEFLAFDDQVIAVADLGNVGPGPETEPTVSIGDASVSEGGTASFTVSLSAPTTSDVTVSYTTLDGSAQASIGSVTHIYNFDGVLTDELGGPSMVNNGGTEGDGTYDFDRFAEVPGFGPSLTGAIDSDTYSIEIQFSINESDGWAKVIDFADRELDDGLYINNDVLEFYDVDAIGSTLINVDQTYHLVLTRDGATDEVTAYIDGVEQFSFNDGDRLATFDDDVAHFFQDDTIQDSENSSGSINYIRIYDGVLTNAEVSALEAGGDPGTGGTGDYTASSDTVTIPAGETSATIQVSTTNDPLIEGDETFSVELTGVTTENATIGDQSATGTIEDDDDGAISGLVATGNIFEVLSGETRIGTTVDYILFSVNTASVVTIDTLSWEVDEEGIIFGGGGSDAVYDANGDGEIAFFDPYIYLFHDAGDGTPGGEFNPIQDHYANYIAYNDDSELTYGDGSIYDYDSYLSEFLTPGDYVLAISSYDLYENEAIAQFNVLNGDDGTVTSEGAGLIPYDHGDYQVTFSGDVTLNGINSDLTSNIVVGTDDPDNLIGTSGADVLFGISGDDTLTGGAGDDELFGEWDDDTFIGAGDSAGVGNDTLDGGDGDDTVDYSSATAGVVVDLAAGTATGEDASVGTDTLNSIEHVIGSGFDDTLTGDGGGNRIVGESGADTMTGGLGVDEFVYRTLDDGTEIIDDVTVAADGASTDMITDFDTIYDKFVFDANVFDFAATFVDQGGTPYDGTNSGQGDGSAFIYDGDYLIYDEEVSIDGYTVIANVAGNNVVAGDITYINEIG